MHAHRTSHTKSTQPRRGFSLTELLVVIGIIVLLVGLLLVALSQVQKKARRTKAESLMQQFANACSAFQTEHGQYPGVIPDDVLLAAGNAPSISSTENAMLHLMGGFRVLSPSDDPNSNAQRVYDAYMALAGSQELTFGAAPNQWKLAVNPGRIGEGPWINGKAYPPYFTPGSDDLVVVNGQIGEFSPGFLPDLVDAWGQPILYLRQARPSGPLVFDAVGGPTAPQPQYLLCGLDGYATSGGLGESEQNQNTHSLLGTADFPGGGSALTVEQRRTLFAVILGHASFYTTARPLYGAARGAVVLISAGADGIYFSRLDGPRPQNTPTNPIDSGNIQGLIFDVGPKVLDDPATGFDDIRVYGGG